MNHVTLMLTRAQRGSLALAAATLLLMPLCMHPAHAGSESTTADKCVPAHQFKTIKDGSLIVAVNEIPPYGGMKGSRLAGVDGDVIYAIAKMECLKVEPHPMGSAAIIPSVQHNRADVGMGDWYRNPTRLKSVTMTDAMYVDQNAFVSKGGVDNFPALKKLRVGAPSGYNFDPGVQQYLDGKLRLYSEPPKMYLDLRAGRIDVGIDSYGSAKYNAPKGFKVAVPATVPDIGDLQTLFRPTQVGLPVNPTDHGLLDALNADIATLRDKGVILKILLKNGLPESSANIGTDS